MTKAEVLECVYDITRKSGQGLPKLILDSDPTIKLFIEELIKDGLVKEHIDHYNHLPDDAWYYPTDGYSIYEDSDKCSIMYVRIYLGHTDLGLDMKLFDIIKNPEYMSNYSSWLSKNSAALLVMTSLTVPDSIIKESPFTDTDIEWIKTTEWYSNNYSISESINTLKIDYDKFKAVLDIKFKLKKLYETNMPKYNSELEKLDEDISINKSDISTCKKTLLVLESYDHNTLIQDIIKNDE